MNEKENDDDNIVVIVKINRWTYVSPC